MKAPVFVELTMFTDSATPLGAECSVRDCWCCPPQFVRDRVIDQRGPLCRPVRVSTHLRREVLPPSEARRDDARFLIAMAITALASLAHYLATAGVFG